MLFVFIKFLKKTFFFLLWTVIIGIVCLLAYLFSGQPKYASNMEYGMTFSKPFAAQLGLDWKKSFEAMLDDLKIKKWRLSAYWDESEKKEGEFDFSDLDWQVEQASKRNSKIILAVGQKLPRWPECHLPQWAKEISKEERNVKLLLFIQRVVERYKNNSHVEAWQVENEPFLKGFGECEYLDRDLLDQEIALVRSLDKSRQIIITASGELDTWYGAAKRADKMGTTLYRLIWNEYFGYVHYPIPAGFYHRKVNLIKKITGVENIFICELQGEPWGPKMLYETTPEQQFKNYSLDEFRKTMDYARKTGFGEAYLWGGEWWYWLKEKHNIPDFWEEAKKDFNQ